jgi:hypothetical protein
MNALNAIAWVLGAIFAVALLLNFIGGKIERKPR